MSDLTLPIIGLTTLFGYFLSKDGKTARKKIEPRNTIEKFDKPSGDNIYNSNMYEEVNREVLARSLENYKAAESPATTGMLPPLFNTYSVVGNEVIMSSDINHKVAPVQNNIFRDVDMTNKLTDVTKTGVEPTIESRPMFNNKYKGKEREDGFVEVDMDINSNISLLTGEKLDKTHNNMVPFFGSNIKQNIEKFTNQTLLDLHTGNVSTFKHKQEVEKFFENQQQDIYGTPIFTTHVDTDRFIPSLFKNNEKPFLEERISAPISGTVNNNIRPEFKTVDELRVGNRLKETYEGRTLPPKVSEGTRGVAGEVIKKTPETFYEKTKDHWFRTTGEFIAEKAQEDYSTNFKATNRKDYNQEYYGTLKNDVSKDRQRMALIGNTEGTGDSIVQNPKRENYEHDWSRNISGYKTVNDYGRAGMKSFETERTTTGLQSHLLNANRKESGMRVLPRDIARETTKQTTLKGDNSGHVKTTFDKGAIIAFEEGITGMDAKTTHKQTTILNNYKGITNRPEGMGYVVNKYDAKTTGKEIITENSKYTGNANFNSESTSRHNYNNAEIREDKEHLLTGARPSGAQNQQTAAGKVSHGEIKLTNNMLLKEMKEERELLHRQLTNIVPNRAVFGKDTRVACDDEIINTFEIDRLEPNLVINQHNQNPYSLYGTNFDKQVK